MKLENVPVKPDTRARLLAVVAERKRASRYPNGETYDRAIVAALDALEAQNKAQTTQEASEAPLWQGNAHQDGE